MPKFECPTHGYIEVITAKGVASVPADRCPFCRADLREAENAALQMLIDESVNGARVMEQERAELKEEIERLVKARSLFHSVGAVHYCPTCDAPVASTSINASRDAIRAAIESDSRAEATEAKLRKAEEHAEIIISIVSDFHYDDCEGPPDGGTCALCDILTEARAILAGKDGG